MLNHAYRWHAHRFLIAKLIIINTIPSRKIVLYLTPIPELNNIVKLLNVVVIGVECNYFMLKEELVVSYF